MSKQFIAVVEREPGVIIPILKGGDGPHAECLAVWTDYATAVSEANQVPMAIAFGATIIDMDDSQ